MKALVLGGTQFVSRALAMELIAAGHEVSILTRGQRPVDYRGLSEHIVADRKDPSSMRCLRGRTFDAVWDVSGYDAADAQGVLDALLPAEGTRYVFVSSGAVYRPSDAPVGEDAPTGGNEHWGAYGLDKLAAEELLARRQRQEGFDLAVVRPAYVYGPGNNLYREAFFFDRIAAGRAVPVPRGGTTAQFVFIADLVRMLVSLATCPFRGYEAFNCAYPEAVGWKELVRAAAAAVGGEVRLKEVDCRGSFEARSFFPFRDCTYLLDAGKAKRWGLEAPSTALREGMRASCAWYRLARPRLSDPKMTRGDAVLAE